MLSSIKSNSSIISLSLPTINPRLHRDPTRTTFFNQRPAGKSEQSARSNKGREDPAAEINQTPGAGARANSKSLRSTGDSWPPDTPRVPRSRGEQRGAARKLSGQNSQLRAVNICAVQRGDANYPRAVSLLNCSAGEKGRRRRFAFFFSPAQSFCPRSLKLTELATSFDENSDGDGMRYEGGECCASN